MENLRDIKKRISSVTSTKQITRTMEMVSTAKIRRALERAEEAGPYKEAMTRMLDNVAGAGSESSEPLLSHHAETKGVLFIVVASDRGLAGGFNIMLERDAENEMGTLSAHGGTPMLVTCGKKPTEYFRYRGFEPVLTFEGTSSEPTMDQADQIASYAMDGYRNGTIDRVVMWYQHARNRVEQDMTIEQILPVSAETLSMPNAPRTHEATTAVHGTSSPTFDFDPSASQVLGYLMPAYIRTVIYHALLDSAAAEHGARRRAMQSATDNATEVITSLTRTYNRIRQGSITTEINEIVGGAAALEDM
jgi:F-type H+-transporting ATPase subunit gamma